MDYLSTPTPKSPGTDSYSVPPPSPGTDSYSVEGGGAGVGGGGGGEVTLLFKFVLMPFYMKTYIH